MEMLTFYQPRDRQISGKAAVTQTLKRRRPARHVPQMSLAGAPGQSPGQRPDFGRIGPLNEMSQCVLT
jgi:hypothetical protein